MTITAKIGFIGQGFIGKNYADDFEDRGYDIVRYSLDEPYIKNKDQIALCDIVFIAVPTPTTPEGVYFGYVEDVLPLIGKGKIAVIKSTLLPGTTKKLQERFKSIYIVHSPEFLREVTAKEDAANPERNIVGIPVDSEEYRQKAELILSVLPPAPFSQICHAHEAEIIKYAGNNFLTMKVVYMNVLYDLAKQFDGDWTVIRDAVAADSRIGSSHMNPIHASGRGAGGHCFIKDLAAFRLFHEDIFPEHAQTLDFLRAIEQKNITLLRDSGKDIGLLDQVYGKEK